MKNLFPLLTILTGFILLLFAGMPTIAGLFVLVGIVMIVERIWPEKWSNSL